MFTSQGIKLDVLPTRDMNNSTDEELLEKFYGDHDNKWLAILLPRYTLLLLGVCMKYLQNEEDARDGVQQVFLKAIGELKKYKVQYFKSWIYMIAKNHCLMRLRDKNKQPLELKEELVQDTAPEPDLDMLYKEEQLLEKLSACVPQLKPEQRECVQLFYLQKKSYQEITDLTGYSIAQVKSYIQNGKRNLKMMLQEGIGQAK